MPSACGGIKPRSSRPWRARQCPKWPMPRVQRCLARCHRRCACAPPPDLLFRTAKRETRIERSDKSKEELGLRDAIVREGDMVIFGLVSASQWALQNDADGIGDVSVIFGGERSAGSQGYAYDWDNVVPDPAAGDDFPAHACPAKAMAMGGMTEILAALLDAGTIQALPASLILQISDW